MLRFPEEIILLLYNEDRGDFAPGLAPHSLHTVLAGAVLMDLALENRIDTDPEHLILVDATPLADDLLDPTLADIAQDTGARDLGYWVAQTAKQGDAIRDKALARLVNRGILEAESEGIFSLSRLVSRSRRYPTIDGQRVEEVRLRIMRVLFTDEIPDPRDIVIICLADASGVFKNILSQSELSEVQDRIELIGKMDLIGQSVIRAIREYKPLASASAPRKEIPQAPGLPLIGNAIGMKRDLRSLLVKQYRNLGPIFRIKAFNRRFVVLVGPEANAFVKRGGKYLRTLETWVDYNKAGGVGRSIISMDGPDHIRLRKELTNMYTHHLIEGRVGEAVHVVQQDIAGWPQDKPLPGLYTWQRIVLDQIGVLALSMPVQFFNEKYKSLDEWNIYFNFSHRQYPTCFNKPKHYTTLCWPISPSHRHNFIRISDFYFENFYTHLYKKGRIFAGIPTKFDEENHLFYTVQKVKRRLELEIYYKVAKLSLIKLICLTPKVAFFTFKRYLKQAVKFVLGILSKLK